MCWLHVCVGVYGACVKLNVYWFDKCDFNQKHKQSTTATTTTTAGASKVIVYLKARSVNNKEVVKKVKSHASAEQRKKNTMFSQVLQRHQ